MLDFRGQLSSLSTKQLREYASFINSELINRQVHFSPTSVLGECSPDSRTIDDFVDYRDNFIDNTDRELLSAECETLGFKRRAKSDAVQNRFLSCGKDSYTWHSQGGPIDNQPIDLEKFSSVKITSNFLLSVSTFTL